ncbi:helix-turn-helix transcriptional regulator [Bradyrhizobium sp. AUGA SZCCT0222]|uniref:helix-turn-helix domain-containing protein n=1 Tax=Bradyrhizobium sp. AUGA SZCCT0222 TaxID=2807668 RepID=UPI001BAC36A5|nr:helix-turn-helix transcriptional regulator [Bradyrhizobium sp. AUGA SZCCT0222]MBR1272714.1 helix-turn-helix transcriptional regulator [Bradyrhizobium sp. AUGA SZCCT0222]
MFVLSTFLFARLTADSNSDSLYDMTDLEIYRIIGAGLAARRKKLRLKQAEVAEQIGLTRASLANIESGRQKLMLHQIYKLATALKVDSITELVPASFSFEQASGPVRLVGSEVNDVQKAQIEQFIRRKAGGEK